MFPREFHGQRSLAGYSPWLERAGHDWVTNTMIKIYWVTHRRDISYMQRVEIKLFESVSQWTDFKMCFLLARVCMINMSFLYEVHMRISTY